MLFIVLIVSTAMVVSRSARKRGSIKIEGNNIVTGSESGTTPLKEGVEVFCTFVIDGDTIIVSDGTKVRLLGIDTPERGEPYYKVAKDYLIGAVSKKRVVLKFDQRRRDKYGRTLAYVYRDGEHINAEIIRRGLGEVYRKEKYVYKEEFSRLEKEAKSKRFGIWR